MAHWIAPSRRALLALGVVVALASVGAVVAGEYVIAPPQPGVVDPSLDAAPSGGHAVESHKEGRCNYGMGSWFG